MFKVIRKQIYEVSINENKIILEDLFIKNFLDHDFLYILNLISNKGLNIQVPTVLDGWDASFIYRKLTEQGSYLTKTGEEVKLFLYMRLSKKDPIWIDYINLFNF